MKIYLTLVLCLLTFSAIASKKAVTEQGDVVILKDDGTWHYENGKPADQVELVLNPNNFTTPSTSSFALKSSKTNSSFAIDPKKWRFKKNENEHDAAEYTYQFKGGDLYGMSISEQVEIDLDELVKIAFENAKGAAPDVEVVHKEYRMVNDNKVIYMEMVGTIQSIRFKYFGYYFSNASGSTQYLAYTGQNLETKYRADIDNFLNGFSTNL